MCLCLQNRWIRNQDLKSGLEKRSRFQSKQATPCALLGCFWRKKIYCLKKNPCFSNQFLYLTSIYSVDETSPTTQCPIPEVQLLKKDMEELESITRKRKGGVKNILELGKNACFSILAAHPCSFLEVTFQQRTNYQTLWKGTSGKHSGLGHVERSD